MFAAFAEFAVSGVDCAFAIARFAYCTTVLAIEVGKASYTAGQAARNVFDAHVAPHIPAIRFNWKGVAMATDSFVRSTLEDYWSYWDGVCPRPAPASSMLLTAAPSPIVGYLPAVSSAPRFMPAVVADVVMPMPAKSRFMPTFLGAIAAAMTMNAMPVRAVTPDVIDVPAVTVEVEKVDCVAPSSTELRELVSASRRNYCELLAVTAELAEAVDSNLSDRYAAMGIRELRKEAARRGVPKYSRKTKAQLIRELVA
ncbi:Rho termination factor N-terminal domain-containing protein [Candidatus Synechococcus calcipolaris G9]|uniref:Rho termination factor N-terminal domain-containing protein n=1 Tax=Candidatus Synechococcus calcipolaris G9 TaxID=1497997 RepID=A0ABT6EYN1_9SYNE|nr:hypothetical protein [Candidatus Synechococcus calcipolaris]MDG2990502.1 Rho termination factor N-terminal domain-containing protein [Candidatus Synechococcus calcipolaris G9]